MNGGLSLTKEDLQVIVASYAEVVKVVMFGRVMVVSLKHRRLLRLGEMGGKSGRPLLWNKYSGKIHVKSEAVSVFVRELGESYAVSEEASLLEIVIEEKWDPGKEGYISYSPEEIRHDLNLAFKQIFTQGLWMFPGASTVDWTTQEEKSF